MNWFTGVCTYLVVWWTVLFAILPMGSRTFAEMGLEPPPGCDPGAPVHPKLGRKFLITTGVSVIVYLVIWAIWNFHLITLPDIPTH